MDPDIQRILKGIEAIYKQLAEIRSKLEQPPVVIETPAPVKSYSKSSSYNPKGPSDKQLGFLKVLIAKRNDSGYLGSVLERYKVKGIEELYAHEVGDLITELKGGK